MPLCGRERSRDNIHRTYALSSQSCVTFSTLVLPSSAQINGMISASAVVADVGEFRCAYWHPLKGVGAMLKSIPGLLAIALSTGAFTPLAYAENILQVSGLSFRI